MDKKIKYFKIHPTGVIFFAILLAATSFYSGVSWTKSKLTGNTSPATPAVNAANAVNFQTTKSNRPSFQFYVMSFCPYGNQIEDVIKPVVDLLGDKANIKPQYIFDKISDINSYCKSRSPDVAQCPTYITNPQAPFKTLAECKKYIDNLTTQCLDDKQYLKIGDVYYASLHGRQEANQNVREICAWNQTENKKDWWSFVMNVNQSCTSQNADACWEEQAKKAGFDTAKITECFNKEAAGLIEKEIALTSQYKISGSPTLMLDNQAFPPENAYTNDGKGALKFENKVVITQDKYRTPNAIKEAVCASFSNPPKECKTVLADLPSTAAAAGGCN